MIKVPMHPLGNDRCAQAASDRSGQVHLCDGGLERRFSDLAGGCAQHNRGSSTDGARVLGGRTGVTRKGGNAVRGSGRLGD